MRISDFDYELPEERIALRPPAVRGQSRLLVLDRTAKSVDHKSYPDLVDYLEKGDLVVLNDTKVIKARLLATNSDGKPRELLLLEDHHNASPYSHKAMYRGKLRAGEQLTVGKDTITVDKVLDDGLAEISSAVAMLEMAEQVGEVPLPPYMHRKATKEDVQRYQTIFAKKSGSVAAPTASLNFTRGLEQKLRAKGVKIAYLTLHVGLGTFMPIRTDEVEGHKMHSEYFEIPEETVRSIREAKASGSKLLAVGTTVARTLEYAAEDVLKREVKSVSGEADIFIYPGYKFKIIDTLVTNFHAPRSTVLMLTAAFAGWPLLKKAYEEALQEKYAFLSYGDSMIII